MAYKEFDYRLSSNGLCTKIAPTSYFPNESKAVKQPATISESVIKAAHEGIETQPTVSDIEKAARAIIKYKGLDPDYVGYLTDDFGLIRDEYHPYAQPLWKFATAIAEVVLRAVAK